MYDLRRSHLGGETAARAHLHHVCSLTPERLWRLWASEDRGETGGQST